jgi:hypothetical protein
MPTAQHQQGDTIRRMISAQGFVARCTKVSQAACLLSPANELHNMQVSKWCHSDISTQPTPVWIHNQIVSAVVVNYIQHCSAQLLGKQCPPVVCQQTDGRG